MINEELKTFINKMRVVGKNNMEIALELKNSGWDEAAIKQALQSKARLNLGKVKFWIWLYGIAILSLLFLLPLGVFKPIGSGVANIIFAISMVYVFGIVPIVTILAIGFKLFFWILRFIPTFKDSKSLKQPDHKWLLVVSTAITGTVMLWVGYFGARVPNGGMGTIIFILLAALGGILLILSLIFAGVLIVIKKIAKRKKMRFQTI